MDSVELVMAFEKAFAISIPDSAAAQMATPHDVIEFILSQPNQPPHSRGELAVKVKSVVPEQLGIPESAYAEHKRFIEDFGID